MVSRVREAVSIAVIGSGDVRSADDAVRMLRETGATGVMIARGTYGNPWIFGNAARIRAGESRERAMHCKSVEEYLQLGQALNDLYGDGQ